jgi:hypothetical protein
MSRPLPHAQETLVNKPAKAPDGGLSSKSYSCRYPSRQYEPDDLHA